MSAQQEAAQAVESLRGRALQVRLRHRCRGRLRASRTRSRHHPVYLRQEGPSPSGYWRGVSRPSSVGFRWRTRSRRGRKVHYPPIDYQDACYYSAPKSDSDRPKSLDEIDPELLKTYEKLGIPLQEQEMLAGVAVDAVFDSVSVATTFKDKLGEMGIIFCSISDAVKEHPDLVQRYLGSVVPYSDNFFATLNSRCSPTAPSSTCRRAALPDGAFHLLPHQRRQHRPVPSARSSSPTRAPT